MSVRGVGDQKTLRRIKEILVSRPSMLPFRRRTEFLFFISPRRVKKSHSPHCDTTFLFIVNCARNDFILHIDDFNTEGDMNCLMSET